jgi:beta-lactamase superfamily II metal-dependent hydrolase
MFYTIKDKNNRLTVIDGGYREDADFVKEVIEKEGGVVDNWIITHPHPDHVGAFNYICDHYKDEIKVNQIYAIDLDYDSYKERAKEWDGFEEYESFLSVTKDMKNLTYVQDGDTFEIDGLKCKVFNAYSDKIKELSKDLANDGSMMFKLYGNKESFLFCADVGHKISDKIIGEYKDELPSDYIQMGHHGNGGLTDEFYQYVKPKVAFFDAPEWLMKNVKKDTGEAGKWKTPEKIKLMEDMGATIYGYPTAPNTIVLK